jgi:hypothetical protein
MSPSASPSRRRSPAGSLLLAATALAAVLLGGTGPRAAPPGTRSPTSCPGGPAGLLACLPHPSRLAATVAQSAGNSLMQGVTGWFTDGARWLLDQISGMLVSATRPDLGAGWWTGKYRLLLAFAALVAAAMLLLAVIQAGAKASWDGLAAAVGVDVPVAALAGSAGPVLAQYLVSVADWLSGALLARFGADTATALGHSAQWLAAFGAVPTQQHVPLVVGALVAVVTIAAALLVLLELLLRANAIYLLVTVVPLAYAMRIWPVLRPVARRTTEVLVAIIFVQPIIALCVSLGAAAGAGVGGLGDATAAQFGTALSGAVMLLLGGLSPWAVLGLLPAVEAGMAASRQRQAASSGPRSALQSVYVGSYLTRLTHAAGRTATSTAGAWWGTPAVVAEVRAAAQATAAHVARLTQGQEQPGGQPAPGPHSGRASATPGGSTGQRGGAGHGRGPNQGAGG